MRAVVAMGGNSGEDQRAESKETGSIDGLTGRGNHERHETHEKRNQPGGMCFGGVGMVCGSVPPRGEFGTGAVIERPI